MTPERLTRCLLDELDHFVEKGNACIRDAKTAAANDPTICDIWLDTARDRVIVRRMHDSPYGDKIAGRETFYLNDATTPDPFDCGLVLTKKSASLTDNLKGLAGWNDRFYPPSPLAAMLASGVLGAGLGYGGASLLSGFLPGHWDKRKFRRTGLLLGGAAGAAPGAMEVLKSLLIRQPVTDGSHMQDFNAERKAGSFDSEYLPVSPRYSTGPVIDSDAMLHTVWRSPMVRDRLTPQEQTLFTGAMSGARQIARSAYLTPADMARLTAGMGAGYASGLVAGKVLGALAGMPESSRQSLANTGMYAGIVKAVVPMLYGLHE